MPNGGEQDERLDESVELEAEIVDEHDDGQGDLAEHGRTLDSMLRQAQQAGLGDAPQARTLKHIRKALRGTRAQIQAAEERGRQRALQEFAGGDGQQAVDALRAEVRAELQADLSRERSLARLGIPADSPVRSLFDGVQGDHKAYERQAALLRAAGVSWDSDPVLRQIGQQQVAQWTQQAEQNGGQVPLDPAAGVPAAVQEQVIRQQVEGMVQAASGALPIDARSPAEQTIDEAQRHPDLMMREDARQTLADRFNAELNGLSHYMGGGGPL